MSRYRHFFVTSLAAVCILPSFAMDTAGLKQLNSTSAYLADNVKINVNKASLQDFLKIKGLTMAKAKAIISYRKHNGDFKTIADLDKVRGFKRIKLALLKEIQSHLSL